MSSEQRGTTALERQIRSQPDELERIATSAQTRDQVRAAVEALKRCNRVWVVGTGTSQHAAELGAAMFQEAGRAVQAVPSMHFVDWAPVLGPKDGLVVISHTGETAYAFAARAEARLAGLTVIPITRRGLQLPDAIETVDKETAETYTVSYTTALLVLAMMAGGMGAESLTDDAIAAVPDAVRSAVAHPAIEEIPQPERLLVIAGVGPASVTAREGALKLREGARLLAEGFDAEYLLHGSAVPLRSSDRLLSIMPPDDRNGFLRAVGAAAEAEGVATSVLSDASDLPPILVQIPLTARLQLLALRYATERGQNPDVVITGNWADEALWSLGAPIVP
jgi:glutamine---fructose-6-phosphate transaminase (isomerizing)